MKDKASDLQLIYVDAMSERGQALDKSRLFQLSEEENAHILTMDVLTADNIKDHLLGILVCSGANTDSRALAHIACKKVYDPGLVNGKLPTSESAGPFAEIVGLLVDPVIRGQGIATELIKRITERTFTTMTDVDACIASCNPASLRVFAKAGYVPMDPSQQVFELAPRFKPMIITKSEFQSISGALE